MLHFAFDPTTHGHWVARYAVRFATHATPPHLAAWHVTRSVVGRVACELDAEGERWRRLQDACDWEGVALSRHLEVSSDPIGEILARAIPPGPSEFLVCGTRVRPDRREIVRGSVAARLLADPRRNTLAIHVVQPGLLGAPRDLLIPLAGHPRGLQALLPWLRRFGCDLSRVHLVVVIPPTSAAWHTSRVRVAPGMSPESTREYLVRVEREAFAEEELARAIVDVRMVAASDATRVILNEARRLRTGFILLGVSERTWTQRVWRGDPTEEILREAPCDVGIYRGAST